MKTIEIISQDVFDKIRSRFSNLQMGDEDGGVTTDPRQARFFDFDFVIAEHNLGRVSISINELGTLKVFYGKTILEDTNPDAQHLWYDFLREMRNFAKRRLLRFDTRDITKSNLNKDDFQYLAANSTKEEDMNMNESIKFAGSTKTSYRVLERTKLIAKHHQAIHDESFGARSRPNNIKALYIENQEGERFKYPFIHVAGAKAMQRHVANGGRPYDDKGNAIIAMSEQIAQLGAFKKHVANHDGMNQSVNEIVGRANHKLDALKHQVENLSKQPHYESWCESFVPNQESTENMDQATLEDYRNKFTVSSFKEDLAQYFPLIHQIMQEAGIIDLEDYVSEGDDNEECCCDELGQKECPVHCDDEPKNEDAFSRFENWADRVVEGYLEPDTIYSLKELLDNGLTLGVDGTSAIEALEGIGIHDENLESALSELSKVNPEADPKETILAWLAKDDPEAAQELGHQAPAPAETPPEPEQGVGEGSADEPVHPDDDSDYDRVDDLDEAPEDRTSYKVARYLFDKGLRYQPENEKDIIKMIGGAMMKMGMDHKQVRYLMSYNEDFLSDTLSELRHMEQAIDEVGMAEGIADAVKKTVKKVAGGINKVIGHGSDEEMRKDLQRKVGVPQTGKKPESNKEDQVINKEKDSPANTNIREIAEMVKSFYDRETGKFPKGETGVIIHIKKELGDEAGALAEKFVQKLSSRFEDPNTPGGATHSPFSNVQNPHMPMGPEYQENKAFEDILRLAGLAK
jgi:hypothetical protein